MSTAHVQALSHFLHYVYVHTDTDILVLCTTVNSGGTTGSVQTWARDVQCIRWGIGTEGKHCVPNGGQLQVEQVARHCLMPDSNIPDPWRTNRPWFTDMMLADCSSQVSGGSGGIPADLVDPVDQDTQHSGSVAWGNQWRRC